MKSLLEGIVGRELNSALELTPRIRWIIRTSYKSRPLKHITLRGPYFDAFCNLVQTWNTEFWTKKCRVKKSQERTTGLSVPPPNPSTPSSVFALPFFSINKKGAFSSSQVERFFPPKKKWTKRDKEGIFCMMTPLWARINYRKREKLMISAIFEIFTREFEFCFDVEHSRG